jgi:hypothetical protein
MIINQTIKVYNEILKTKLKDSGPLRLPRVLLPPHMTPIPPWLAKRPSWSSMAMIPVSRCPLQQPTTKFGLSSSHFNKTASLSQARPKTFKQTSHLWMLESNKDPLVQGVSSVLYHSMSSRMVSLSPLDHCSWHWEWESNYWLGENSSLDFDDGQQFLSSETLVRFRPAVHQIGWPSIPSWRYCADCKA